MKEIAVLTGARSDYDLLSATIKKIHEDEEMKLHLLVTGMHLSDVFGYTVDQIVKDGFPISFQCKLKADSSKKNIIIDMATLSQELANYFTDNSVDLLVLLGDRFETFAAAQVAMIFSIPVVHIHGGELTYGAIDDMMRHSITKMSHYHLVATEVFKKRVLQLGESEKSIRIVGAPGVENIKKIKPLSLSDLEDEIQFKLGGKYILFTLHSETISSYSFLEQIEPCLSALDKYKDYQVLITYPNMDEGADTIIQAIENYKKKNMNRVYLTKSLGMKKYISAVKHCSIVMGNSSSGVIEVPSLGKTTVNIGDRQTGRPMGKSIFNCAFNTDEIEKAMSLALDFNEREIENPYDHGSSSEHIYQFLKELNVDKIIPKKFEDRVF